MAECTFCGAALRPGATFCAACGHAPGPAGSTLRIPQLDGSRSPAEPNPRAALLLFAMPTTVFIGVALFQMFFGFGSASVIAFVLYLVVGSLVGGVAWAVWRGAAWARWLSFLASLAWGVFMVVTIPDQIGMLRDPFASSYPSLRQDAIFGLVMAALQLLLVAGALYYLVFPRGFSASRPRG